MTLIVHIKLYYKGVKWLKLGLNDPNINEEPPKKNSVCELNCLFLVPASQIQIIYNSIQDEFWAHDF